MLAELYQKLAWLQPAPVDFRQRCTAVVGQAEAGYHFSQLAAYALDENQLVRVASTLKAAQKSGASLASLSPITLGLLGNATLAPLIPALVATGLRHGLLLNIIKADYGQTVQEAIQSHSAINLAKPDMVLVALDYHGFPLLRSGLGSPSPSERVAESLGFLQTLRDGFRAHSNAVCLFQTVPPPIDPLFGHADRYLPESARWLCESFNQKLSATVLESSDLLVDIAALAETIGLADWYSPTQWNIAKFAFDAMYIPLYADHVCRVIAAARGKSRRCLILDLDNTVWGGVIGDDGLEGILLGQGDPTGEAFLEVQRTALRLRARGIVLAVSSKNTDELARRVFREHPEMLLREEHIAVFQANWNDKASNITAIAEALSLGLDTMVFLDDNPVERGLVRELLPQVAVPELPEDPALYARTLLAAGYFESTTFSQEDRKRADFYQGNAQRVALQGQAGNVDAYLASLNMQITFSPFDAIGRARITQLINKSNQFNLTTRRYTEAEVAVLENDASVYTLQVRLADAFGDNGMISVIICRPLGPSDWSIDTWLMSCRVLGRKVEEAVLAEILHQAKMAHVSWVRGRYIPSDRNGMVSEHYRKLGFTEVSTPEHVGTAWQIATDTPVPVVPMRIIRNATESFKVEA